MSWFRARQPTVKPDYTGLQLQTAVSTLPIPIVWGQTKVAANLVFYANFQNHGGQSGGKGGLFGSPQITPYSYSADLILALCEGPISGIGFIWRDQSTYTLSGLGLTLFNGTTPQAVWGYLATAYPTQALAYQGTAYVCAANYNLGGAASIGNHNFEVIGALAGTGANGVDADPAQVIYDLLTNAQYGVGFDPGSIGIATLYGSGGDASLQTYCRVLGLAFSPALISSEQASSVLSRWLLILNCAAVWSGGELKFIPYDDTGITAGNFTQSVSATIPIPALKSDGSYPPPHIVVSAAPNWVSDGGVVYSFTGAALTYAGATAPTTQGKYGISPNGVYLFYRGESGASVTITYIRNVPISYLPNTAAIYTLTDLDFVDDKSNQDPVLVERADPFSLPTVQRIHCLSRSNQYASTPIEARDQSQIEVLGLRVASTIQASEICDEVNVAPVVAQTLLQRSLYVRTKFKFKLSWEFCLLDPMDVVAITDTKLGLSLFPVRIISISEEQNGTLSLIAEEFIKGVSTPGANPTNASVSWQPNRAAVASAINPPVIYEPPPALTNNTPQIWFGASGGSDGVADPNWGGATIWASVDNSSYSKIGTIAQPLRQGFLTADVPSGAGWDTANTLAVNLGESGGLLTGASESAAQSGATLSLIDSELLAYENAILTGPNTYGLTGLQRGFAGTASVGHSGGAAFARLDGAIVKYDLPATWIGLSIFFKFQSFNVFGAGAQDLSVCDAYPYTPNGSGVLGPISQSLAAGANLDFGLTSQPASIADDWGLADGAAIYPIAALDLGAITN